MRRFLFLLLLAAIMSAPPVLAQSTNQVILNDPAPDATNTTSPPVPPPGQGINPPGMGGTAPAQAEDIEDIRPPLFFLHSWFWLWITLAALAAVAGIVALWRWLKPGPEINAKTAYDLVLERLEKAKALLREDDAMPYTLEVSEAIRTYLGQRFQARSTRQTTEEFLRQMETNPHTPLAEHRELLREFLTSCDLVKFAKYRPHLEELEKVHDRAFSFVTATKPEPLVSAQNGSTQ